MANIEDSGDIKSVKDSNADGIGLFRTEFLFMNREDLPNEEEQFQSYKSIVKSMRGREVIIRTLDSGADKMTAADKKETSNPALGLRAIRLCLSEPRLFMTQLRAILRASYFGKIKILIPMISSIQELKQVKLLIERAKLALSKEKIKYDENIEIGGMIEVPAVAINADFFAKELDFLSIGTNDLIQYTLAIDRTDDSVSHLYNSIHPSVLKLMALTINAAKKHNKEVAVCGEMAGDTKLTRLLLAMGLTNFSMHPASILQVKQKILETNIKKIKPLSSKILKSTDSDLIESIINKINL
jgi:phosphotransferase system enzyme I (PtsI)